MLVCQRAEGKHLAGQWEFPGGKVEEGEGFEEALVREIDEELGCRVAVGTALKPVEHRYSEVSIRLHPFLCTVADGEPEALEHAAVAWVKPGGLSAFGLAAADCKIAAMLAREYGGTTFLRGEP